MAKFKPLPLETLVNAGLGTINTLTEDFEHFMYLTPEDRTVLYLKFKRLKPFPELKEDHAFLLIQMKEEMEFSTDPTPRREPPEIIRQILKLIDTEVEAIESREKVHAYQAGRARAFKSVKNFIIRLD